MITAADIQAARERFVGYLPVTPCVHSAVLSERTGCEVWLKLENLQRTGSFKVRGASNRILQIEADRRALGVVAASAGNHAQGVAYAARHLGVPALIVMPEFTPLGKIERTRELGARVELHGEVFDDAQEHARRLAHEHGMSLIPPFDQPDVIAGQGTVGLEILDQVPGLDAVMVGIGGGGLISGIGAALADSKAISIYGVQSEAAPAMERSLAAGQRTPHPVRPTIAEGLTVRQPGELTYALVRDTVTEVLLVTESEIEDAIYRLADDAKLVVEGAGAAALAPLLQGRLPDLRGKTVVVVVSGGNIDLSVLGRIVERAQVLRHRLVRLRVPLPDRPGALATLLSTVAGTGANVRRINHDRSFAGSDFWEATVVLTLEIRDAAHETELLTTLVDQGYRAEADRD